MNDLVRTKCDLAALEAGYYLDRRFSDYVIEWIETNCTFTSGDFAGKPFILLPWQRWAIEYIYAWRKPDGRRRFSIVSLWIPRGNGKTEFAAALTLYHLIGDDEPSAEICFAACTSKQASVAYKSTIGMVHANPDLKEHLWCHVVHGEKRVDVRRSEAYPFGGECYVVSGTDKAKQGMRCSFAVYDEIADNGASRELYDAIRNSMGKRSEPLLLTTSTSGYNKMQIGYECYRIAKRIIDGEITDDFSTCPIVYEAAPDADWRDIDVYKACNPSWEIMNHDFIMEQIIAAKNETMKEASLKTFHLNQWVGSAMAWIPSVWWYACADETIKESDFYGSDAIIGCDLSQRQDLTCYTVIVEKDGLYYLFPRTFIPFDTVLYREKKEKIKYRQWAAKPENCLYFCTGDRIYQDDVKQHITEDLDRFNIREIRFDPYGATKLMEEIEATKACDVVAITQSRNHMTPATVEFYNLVKDGKIRHCNNDVLNMCVQNAVAKENNMGQILVEKGKCLGRVDAVTASIIGLSYFADYQQSYSGLLF